MQSAFERLQKNILQKFPSGSFHFEKKKGDQMVSVPPPQVPPLLQHLKETRQFNFLMQVAGADYPDRKNRFEVSYELFSSNNSNRLRVKTSLSKNQEALSVSSLWKTANWFEREVYDMYGVIFKNHPRLARILCHHQFQGHPLRKDFASHIPQHCSTPEPMHFDTADAASQSSSPVGEEQDDDFVPLNIGPAHPATHGTLRIMVKLKGEKVQEAGVEIGYLHRCFEKMAETHPYNQVIPYTDRLNYCSAPMNNVGYCKTVEKLLGVEIPPKAQALRVILCELSRIIDHIVCIGANAVDLGALTGFFQLFTYREKVYTLFEKLCGARLTVSLTRIGGMANEPPKNWFKDVLQFCREMKQGVDELETLLTHNRIWLDRTQGIGGLSVEEAISWGYTGPCLRAAGFGLDLRKADPYYGYDKLDFNVPVGTTGDAYDRYLVRVAEMRESIRIVEQVASSVPAGDVTIKDRDIVLPKKKDVYGNIEGLMQHFMLVMHGLKPPVGEIYSATEAANGELGFYLVSDGSGQPYRLKVRPPCFAIYQSFPHLIKGLQVADVISVLGSLNIIAGELDR